VATTKAPTRIRRLARVLRAERRVEAAAEEALASLRDLIRTTLTASDMDPVTLDDRSPAWRAAVDEHLTPVLADVYLTAYDAELRTPPALTAAGPISPADRAASEYLLSATNRMYGVADTMFDQIRRSLEEGRRAEFTINTDAGPRTVYGESIQELSRRVDAFLTDAERWKNRATVVARTEVISANNAGAQAAAVQNAAILGASEGEVVKEWLATHDHRTRPTHQTADGQQVLGLTTPFSVGAASLQQPGDPSGPAAEVVQCRCTTLYHYPGDPDYPGPESATLRPPMPVPTRSGPPSAFTADGLQAALDPTRRRTAAAIRKDLEATSSGKNLAAAIKQFTETRGGVTNLRKNIAATLDGSASATIRDRTRAFLDAMNTYPTDAVPDLYRGIAVKVEEDTAAWWDAFEDQFKVGKKMHLNASSFSSSEKKAAEFQSSIGGTRRAGSNHTAVRIVLEGQPHALPVEALSKFKSEREWITGGEFEVVGYSPATKQQPYYRVVVRQVRPLEVPS